MSRAFQIADMIKTHYHGTQVASIFYTEDQARAAGYRKTSDHDQYGYTVWEYSKSERPYYRTETAIVIPI